MSFAFDCNNMRSAIAVGAVCYTIYFRFYNRGRLYDKSILTDLNYKLYKTDVNKKVVKKTVVYDILITVIFA